jgi:hypothetical protein
MMASARARSPGLYYPDGSQRRGGSHTVAFWAGYNGTRSPSAIPGTIGWACYAAGRDFAKEFKRG